MTDIYLKIHNLQGLKDWVDGSDKGVVLFSMGTSVIVDIEVQKKINVFCEAFSLFPEFRFLWKMSSNSLPGQPNNVLVQKWLPQHDIMGEAMLKAYNNKQMFHKYICEISKTHLAIFV